MQINVNLKNVMKGLSFYSQKISCHYYCITKTSLANCNYPNKIYSEAKIENVTFL